jgi:hypothetical protein
MEFMIGVGVILLIAAILFGIMWFLWPEGTRPLPPKKPRTKRVVVMQPDYSLRPDEVNASYKKMKMDAEYEEYLKNFPMDDPRR